MSQADNLAALATNVNSSGVLQPASGGTGVTSATGTGSVVLSNSPTLVTPTLGSASATQITTALGSAGSPALTFTGDTNTGIFSPTADTIAFTEGGVESMRITASGSVLINTTAEADKFTVNGNMCLNTSIGYVFSNGGGSAGSVNSGFGLDGGGNTLRFYTGGAANERMRIDSSGNVGIGTTATTTYRATIANNGGNQLRLYATDVASSTTNTIDFWYLDGGGSPYNNTSIRSLSTANAGNGNLAFYTTPTSGSLTERMRIDSSGNAYVGGSGTNFGATSPIYAKNTARAWLFYSGNTQTVQNSFNVSSVSYLGTGQYQINWANTFPTIYYALVTGQNKGDANNDMNAITQTGTTGGSRQQTTSIAYLNTGYGGNFLNPQQVCAVAFF